MAQVPIETLLKRCGSIYRLVILASKRAKEIAEGAPPLVDVQQKKVTSVALEEIVQGKVLYKPESADEASAKKGRGAKAREEKKKRVTT
ncbi:MAG: DNA-directed RNA polymerase subunit omega [Candidatus Omnitrophica bacterium]|nr:DNA-directed RNA polymerase subunit omega [Candidatus Omnitrophota bacterium]